MQNNISTPLFYINPLVKKSKIKYIYGTDNDAFKLFVKLTNYRIYINGFISDTEIQKTLIHKPVVSFADAIQQNALILSWNDITIQAPNQHLKAEDIFLIPDEVIENGAIIWGSGKIGNSLCEYFLKHNIHIHCIIDKSCSKWGTSIYNIPVKSPASLPHFSDNIPIIEAFKKYWEIDTILNSINEPNRNRYYQERILNYADHIVIDNMNNLTITFLNIDVLATFFENRILWMYGSFNISKHYVEVLRLLDFNVKGCLYDNENDIKDFNPKYNLEKCRVEEIIYEETPLILLTDDSGDKCRFLKKLGLSSPNDFVKANQILYLKHDIKKILDINLGYTYSDGIYPGFKLIGNNKSTDYKIVTLGGSTTDGYLYPFKSWPDFLSEKIDGDVTIYNGGIIGYNSACELQKMIRDVLYLKPNMILIYDGVNDIEKGCYRLFETPYLSHIYSYVNESMAEYRQNGQPWSGIPVADNIFDTWLYRVELMHSIAESLQIDFHVFVQPHLLTKKSLDEREQLLERYKAYYTTDIQDNILDSVDQFMNNLSDTSFQTLHPYIHNLMSIFDDTKDVYIDHCHVWEFGNEIIADEIYKYICKQLS